MGKDIKSVVLIISSLTSGGAERVMTKIANYWAKKGWNVTLITLSSNETDFYKVHERVKRVSLDLIVESKGILSRFINILKRIKRLRTEIKKSNANNIISFLNTPNLLTIIATRMLNKNVIISERSEPRSYDMGLVKSFFRRLLYPRADYIVVQTESVSNWAKKFIAKEKIVVIPNFIESNNNSHIIDTKNTTKKIVSMGRLEEVKKFDILIKAFHGVTKQNPDWSLVILGEGSKRDELETLIKSLNLQNKVSLPGRINSPNYVLKEATIFVLTSKYEGFPNSLLEAMSIGLPVISTDCPSGPREIIDHEINGILVPVNNIELLEKEINKLIDNEDKRLYLSQNALNIVKTFDKNTILDKWESLFI